MSIDTCPVPSRFLSGGMLRDKSRYVPLCPVYIRLKNQPSSFPATDKPILRLFLRSVAPPIESALKVVI